MTPYGVRRRLKHTSAERGMLGSGSEANDHPVPSPSGNPPQGRPPRSALRQGYVAPDKGPLLCLVLATGGSRNPTLCQRSHGLAPLDDPGATLHFIATSTRRKPRNSIGISGNDPATSHGYSAVINSDECMSCPSCLIDLSSRALAQRKQHIRRCSQPPPNASGLYACPDCDMQFRTYAGSRPHAKRSHPVSYNEQEEQLTTMRASTSKAQWSNAEERALASLEYNLPPNMTQKEINTRLSTLHKSRTIEAIRKQRQKQSYKQCVAQIKLELQLTQTNNSNSFQDLSNILADSADRRMRLVCPLTPRIGLSKIDSISPWNRRSTTIPGEETCSLINNLGILTFLREIEPSCSSSIQDLLSKLFNSLF